MLHFGLVLLILCFYVSFTDRTLDPDSDDFLVEVREPSISLWYRFTCSLFKGVLLPAGPIRPRLAVECSHPHE